MSIKSAISPADLFKEAKRLAAQEAILKRDRLALAKKLIEAGQALGGDDLQSEKPPRQKRRYVRRRRVSRTSSPPSLKTSPEVQPTASHTTSPTRDGRFSATGWTATMLKILVDADRPMTYAELKVEISKTHLAPKLARTDKSFYGGIGKLEAKREAFRHNRRISAASVYERHMRDLATGLVKEEPVINTGGEHRSPTKGALLEFLEANIQGARVGEIINDLEKRPELKLSANKNSKTAVYNLIARLVRRGVLMRDGNIIRLPRRTNGVRHDEQPSSQTPVN